MVYCLRAVGFYSKCKLIRGAGSLARKSRSFRAGDRELAFESSQAVGALGFGGFTG